MVEPAHGVLSRGAATLRRLSPRADLRVFFGIQAVLVWVGSAPILLSCIGALLMLFLAARGPFWGALMSCLFFWLGWGVHTLKSGGTDRILQRLGSAVFSPEMVSLGESLPDSALIELHTRTPVWHTLASAHQQAKFLLAFQRVPKARLFLLCTPRVEPDGRAILFRLDHVVWIFWLSKHQFADFCAGRVHCSYIEHPWSYCVELPKAP